MNRTFLVSTWFLANRTDGRAYAKVLRLSPSLTLALYIVAKRCVL